MAKKFQLQLASQAPLERISALGKVASILKSYEKPEDGLNNIDKKLVEGLYNRDFNDFQYLANIKSNLKEMMHSGATKVNIKQGIDKSVSMT